MKNLVSVFLLIASLSAGAKSLKISPTPPGEFIVDPYTNAELVKISKTVPVFSEEVLKMATAETDLENYRTDVGGNRVLERAASVPGSALKMVPKGLRDTAPTIGRVTYLLPGYERLSPSQKAYVLLREGLIRKVANPSLNARVDAVVLSLIEIDVMPIQFMTFWNQTFHKKGCLSTWPECSDRDRNDGETFSQAREDGLAKASLDYLSRRLGRSVELQDFMIGGVQDAQGRLAYTDAYRFGELAKKVGGVTEVFGQARLFITGRGSASLSQYEEAQLYNDLVKACAKVKSPDSLVMVPTSYSWKNGSWGVQWSSTSSSSWVGYSHSNWAWAKCSSRNSKYFSEVTYAQVSQLFGGN